MMILTIQITSISTHVSVSAAMLFDDDEVNDIRTITSPPLHHDQAVDFRDLFLPPAEAMELGGSGLQPYGDLISTYVWPNVQSLITRPAAEGGGGGILQTQVIEPMSLAQSGIVGSLVFPEELFHRAIGKDNVTVSNIRINNLESVVPVELSQPTTQPHVLSNKIVLGHHPDEDEEEEAKEDIEIKVRLSLSSSLEGNTNEIDLGMTLSSATLLLHLRVLVDEQKLFQLPLQYILYPGCWMGTLLYDEDEDSDVHQAIHLQTSRAILAGALSMDATCASCDHRMEDLLPRLRTSWQMGISTNDDTVLTEGVESLLEDAVWNVWEWLDLPNVMHDMTKFCPNNPDYQPKYENLTNALENLSVTLTMPQEEASWRPITLSRRSFETVIAGGLMGVQTALIVAAVQLYSDMDVPIQKNGTTNNDNNTKIDQPSEKNYIDWQSVTILDGIRPHLTPDNINYVVQNSGFLDPTMQEGALVLLPGGAHSLTVNTTVGYLVTMDQVSIGGLDSLSAFTILDPVGPYELETEIQFKSCSFVPICPLLKK
jgi:hypothetical protein